ncbi:MAG: response regulator [Anaerolineales bacterium]|nr:response regulator [Anaerolineales bacterium]
MKTILVVEDHDEFRSIVNDFLQVLQPDATVHNAMDGAAGLALAQQLHPDLVLLDIHMPEKDGYQVAKQLHQDPDTRDIPIVIMTSARDAGPMLIELSHFCQGLLAKPFSFDDLSQVLAQLEEVSGQ